MDFPAVEMSSALVPRWGATPTRRSGFSAPHGSIRSHVTCRCSHGPSDGAPDAPLGGEKSAGKALLRIAVGAATIAAPWVSPFVASTVSQPGSARAATTWKTMRNPPDIEPGAHPSITVRELTNREREFAGWLDGIRDECTKRGLSESTVGSCLNELEPLPETVVEKTSSSHVLNPEKNLSVDAYLRRMVSRDRVAKGAALMVEHAELLNEIEREYGVPPEILVAIWGIESHFGGFQGEHDCIRALATLGFEHRHWKGEYFGNELVEAIRIVDEGHVPAGDLVGSWAGALGQCQFMPSNFHRYAVDKDGDGRADIWKSLPDVFASMANFLNKYCEWNPNVRPAGFRVSVEGDQLPEDVIGGWWGERKTPKPASYFLWNGVKPMHNTLRLPRSAESVLLMPEGKDGPAFLALCNFRAIMRYNPSTNYAMAVSMLAQEIVDEVAVVSKEAK